MDYDDTYQVIAEHASGVIGSITVDVSTPKAERAFEAWEEKYYIEWQGTPDSLKSMNTSSNTLEGVILYDDIDHTDGYNGFIVENAYYDEIKAFIECIVRDKMPEYDFETDRKVLKIIDYISN